MKKPECIRDYCKLFAEGTHGAACAIGEWEHRRYIRGIKIGNTVICLLLMLYIALNYAVAAARLAAWEKGIFGLMCVGILVLITLMWRST